MEQVLSENNLVISVDAMGGDNAPLEIIKGTIAASKEYNASFILVGNAETRAESRSIPSLFHLPHHHRDLVYRLIEDQQLAVSVVNKSA